MWSGTPSMAPRRTSRRSGSRTTSAPTRPASGACTASGRSHRQRSLPAGARWPLAEATARECF
eukprot:15482760-Alexandrium_andersonii.AAC.1